MSKLNHEELSILTNIRSEYLNDPQTSLLPEAVKDLLDDLPTHQVDMDCAQAKPIYEALLNNTWFLQRQLSPALKEAYTKSKLLVFLNSCKKKECDVVFAPENFELIASDEAPDTLAKTILILEKAQLLTANRRAFLEFEQSAIQGLEDTKMLTQEYLDLINVNKTQLVHGIIALKSANLLTTMNRSKLMTCEDPFYSSRILIDLANTTSPFASLINPLISFSLGFLGNYFADAVIYLLQPLTGILLHPFLSPIIYISVHLSLWFVFCFYVAMQDIFNIQSRSGLLTQDNFDLVLNIQTSSRNLEPAIGALATITQDNLEFLIDHELILLTDTTRNLWTSLPSKAITSHHLREIGAICDNETLDLPTRQNNFIHYMNQLILKLESKDKQISHAQNPSGLFSQAKKAQSNDNPAQGLDHAVYI